MSDMHAADGLLWDSHAMRSTQELENYVSEC